MCGAFRIVDAVFVLFVCFGGPAQGNPLSFSFRQPNYTLFNPVSVHFFKKKVRPKHLSTPAPCRPPCRSPCRSPCRPPTVVPKLCLGMRPREALLRPSPVVPKRRLEMRPAKRRFAPPPLSSPPVVPKRRLGMRPAKRRFAPLYRHSGIFIPPAHNSATAIFHQRNENIRNPPTIGLGLRRGGRPPSPPVVPLSFPSAAWECVPRSAASPLSPLSSPTAAWKRQKQPRRSGESPRPARKRRCQTRKRINRR